MLSGEVLLENVSKMLGVVEEFGTLCTFVEALHIVVSGGEGGCFLSPFILDSYS